MEDRTHDFFLISSIFFLKLDIQSSIKSKDREGGVVSIKKEEKM